MKSCCCRCWRFWRERRVLPISRASARRSLGCCAASARLPAGRRATIIWATFSPPLDAQAFRRCFVAWVAGLTKTPADLIAIDGKTSRRSGKKGSKDAIHMVSAFAARQRLVLAQTKVGEKSNEILAVPALLDMLSIEG